MKHNRHKQTFDFRCGAWVWVPATTKQGTARMIVRRTVGAVSVLKNSRAPAASSKSSSAAPAASAGWCTASMHVAAVTAAAPPMHMAARAFTLWLRLTAGFTIELQAVCPHLPTRMTLDSETEARTGK